MKKFSNSKVLAALGCRAETKYEMGHYSTARNYRRARNSFAAYLSAAGVEGRSFSGTVVRGYASWLEERGCLRNTVSFYLRILRATLVSMGGGMELFEDVFTGVERTRKRALDKSAVHAIHVLKIEGRLALTRDLFVFSLAARGMAFVDMAFLRWSDITAGYVQYARRKTGQFLSVRLEPCMKEIIDRWRANGSPFVFPILSAGSDGPRAFLEYESGLRTFNRDLKALAKLIGCPELSSYYARHTWASTARSAGVPLSVISEGMGHTSERTTRIYLNSFDDNVLDQANKSVLGKLGF